MMNRRRWLLVAVAFSMCLLCWLEGAYRRFWQPFFDRTEQSVPLITLGGMES